MHSSLRNKQPTAPEDALAFYKSYADEASGDILEPMCGTGRFLLHLAKDGYNIDASHLVIRHLSVAEDFQNKKITTNFSLF